MSIVFLFFHKIKKATSNRIGYFSFIVLWLSMEYLHLNWDLSWPWLTLGNVFANVPLLVQWYEFTGFLGGSFFVILMNLLLFRLYEKNNSKKFLIFPLLLFFTSSLISGYIYFNFKQEKNNKINVLIVQPNIDPYFDKFSRGYKEQLTDFIALAKANIKKETQLLLAPETALLEGIWENKINAAYRVRSLRDLQNEFPNLNILIGATTYKMFNHAEKITNTARKMRNQNVFYDVYNSAIFIPSNGDVQVYHKRKLVPGAEKMPFPNVLDPLAKLIVNLGGVSGSLGSENSISSFLLDSTILSPLICYESVYGEVKLGVTNLLAIITNDGWWKNTAGYKQHFQYARLRAIEQRKSIVRSANTGISAVINARGDILQKTKWDEATCIVSKVELNNITTFYSQFGDYIGRLSMFVSSILLIVVFVQERLRQ